MCLTLGSLLQRLQGEEGNGRRYAFLMPSARGPCRFGAYNLLLQIVLERLGWGDRVRVWSPDDGDYFRGVDRGVEVLVVAGCAAADALQDALLDAWPSERTPGEAQRVHRAWYAELMALIREAAGGDLSLSRALAEVATGRLFGITGLLRRAAAELSQLRRPGALPTVLVVGEIYVRCEPAANDHLLERLARRGVRAHLAPFTEWLEYQDHINVAVGRDHSVGLWLKSKVRGAVQDRVWETVAERFGWPARTTVPETLDAAGDYLRYQLEGEAVLTLGGPVHEWRCGNIDGAVSVGPLECMPAKVAEAQLFHAAELEGLPSVTLSVHGDPVDPGRLDDFVFEVKRRFRRRRAGVAGGEARGAAGRPVVEVSPVIGDRPARRNGNGVKRAPARRPRPGRPRP